MMVWLTPLLSRKQVTREAFAGQVTRKLPIEQDALFHMPCVCGLGQPASLGRANHDAGDKQLFHQGRTEALAMGRVRPCNVRI